MSHDDSHDHPPAPEAPASRAERSHAASFAALIERVVTGQRLPPAMTAEERELLEVATFIHSGTHSVELAPAVQATLVEDALAQAVGAPPRMRSVPPADALQSHPAAAARGPREASRRWRVVPWAAAAAAIAAATVVMLRPPPPTPRHAPLWQTSRPSDPLVGAISRDRAGDARARIDIIYADRLSGYRAIYFESSASKGARP